MKIAALLLVSWAVLSSGCGALDDGPGHSLGKGDDGQLPACPQATTTYCSDDGSVGWNCGEVSFDEICQALAAALQTTTSGGVWCRHPTGAPVKVCGFWFELERRAAEQQQLLDDLRVRAAETCGSVTCVRSSQAACEDGYSAPCRKCSVSTEISPHGFINYWEPLDQQLCQP